MLLGLYMGIASDLQLRQVHSTIMLPGFVTLAVYGFVFRLWPAMKKAPLAQAQFWTASAGVLLLIVGSYFFATSGSVPLAAVGSIVFIAAGAMLFWQFWAYGSGG
jgi:uncharacterized membrane protein YdjX (TVP38/TMEM64 family)